MAEILNVYEPPTEWYTIETELTLDPGTWAAVSDVKFYSETDANTYAAKYARDNSVKARVVKHTADEE